MSRERLNLAFCSREVVSLPQAQMPTSSHLLPQPLPVPAGNKHVLGKTFTGSMLNFANNLQP